MGLSLGAYLLHPVTDKHSSDEENGKIIYGVSSMQGWRETQEVCIAKKNYEIPYSIL